VEHCDIQQTGGYVWRYNPTTAVLLAYRQTDPQAVGGADVPLVAVANGVDLSATTVRAMFWGR
jgi:hypothetical protein